MQLSIYQESNSDFEREPSVANGFDVEEGLVCIRFELVERPRGYVRRRK